MENICETTRWNNSTANRPIASVQRYFLGASEVIRLTLPYLSEMAGKERSENASLLLAFLEL